MKSTIGCLPALDLGSRGAPCGDSFADTANIGNVLDFSYNFSLGSADNGNVTGIANNRDTTRSQSFTYDALNRIATAATASTYATSPAYCWGEAFSYDAWGDLQMIGGASSAYTDCTQESLTVSQHPLRRQLRLQHRRPNDLRCRRHLHRSLSRA